MDSSKFRVADSLLLRALHGLMVASLGLLLVTVYGHSYRYPIHEQLKTWHNGVRWWDGDPTHNPNDSFDYLLYEQVRSVQEARKYIEEQKTDASEEELLYATFDFVRTRFLHFMYPRHTWRTNPLLAFLEFVRPTKDYNAMLSADVTLRHSAVENCGGAATTFVEVYRALGGEATVVGFRGPPSHLAAEARVGGKRYFVDADLEVIVPLSTKEFVADRALIDEYYGHLQGGDFELYQEVFSNPPIFVGYDGPPTLSPRMYRAQVWLEVAKFGIPVTGFAFFALLRQRVHSRIARSADG